MKDSSTAFVVVRLPVATRQAVYTAAQAEDLPLSTWIRNQIVAALYLTGVQEAPQVIYQGFRASIQDLADQVAEMTVASRALPALLENLMAASMMAGGLNPVHSHERAYEMVVAALAEAAWKEWPEGE